MCLDLVLECYQATQFQIFSFKSLIDCVTAHLISVWNRHILGLIIYFCFPDTDTHIYKAMSVFSLDCCINFSAKTGKFAQSQWG